MAAAASTLAEEESILSPNLDAAGYSKTFLNIFTKLHGVSFKKTSVLIYIYIYIYI
jgi:hypothetical protein